MQIMGDDFSLSHQTHSWKSKAFSVTIVHHFDPFFCIKNPQPLAQKAIWNNSSHLLLWPLRYLQGHINLIDDYLTLNLFLFGLPIYYWDISFNLVLCLSRSQTNCKLSLTGIGKRLNSLWVSFLATLQRDHQPALNAQYKVTRISITNFGFLFHFAHFSPMTKSFANLKSLPFSFVEKTKKTIYSYTLKKSHPALPQISNFGKKSYAIAWKSPFFGRKFFSLVGWKIT